MTGALAALAPDVDHVLELAGAREYLLYHRTATHSILACAVASLAAAAWPGAGRSRRAAIVGAALASHLALDCATPFGTAILWPFSDARFAFDALPVLAPWFMGAAVLAWLATRWLGHDAAARALMLLGAFVLLEWKAGHMVLPDPGAERTLAVASWKRPLEEDFFEPDRSALSVVNAELRPLVARLRVPGVRRDGDRLIYHDKQFDVIDAERPPIVVIREPDGTVRVEQRALGLQPLIWLAVVLGVLALGRKSWL